jgi:hypothetical protein
VYGQDPTPDGRTCLMFTVRVRSLPLKDALKVVQLR